MINAAYPVYDAERIGNAAAREGEKMFGAFKKYRLNSAYQPIFSLAHKRIVGYEALIRAHTDQHQAIRPDVLFRQTDLGDIVFLDRLCRYIHMANFQSSGDAVNWLFLNVSPQTTTHGKKFGPFFSAVLKKFNLPPSRVVIEIVEHPISDEENIGLIDTVAYYKEIGCLIAIDDFGAGHSNFDRIWTLKPDIVKLDRSMLLRASTSDMIRQLLPSIVSLLHQAGSLVVMEGIETEAQAVIAMESDTDLVQGYYFARPHPEWKELAAAAPPFESLYGAYKESEAVRGRAMQKTYSRYHTPFEMAAALIQAGKSLEDASLPLFQDDSVIRCYLLEPGGVQLGYTATSKKYADTLDSRFKPLEDARSADWFRRPYMRRAIMHPGQLQVTRPYLSITGAHMCSTLSMMLRTGQADVILCCDLTL